MTYCVGLRLNDGLVMLSDTRTNAGLDNIATFCKMHVVEEPGERMIALMSSGNLAISQAVISLLTDGVDVGGSGKLETLSSVPSMFRAAQIVSEAVRQTYNIHREAMQSQGVSFEVGMMLGGQIRGREVRLYQIYSAGNFIEATEDTPFLQLGEHKYGKPILDRAVTYEMDVYDALKLALISMDSTLRSNLSVGLPLDLMVYKRDALATDIRRRITEDDPYFRHLREYWSGALREAHQRLPRPHWAQE
ncbi:MAG: peptidase [Alphaproteobacteria bacterium]